MFNAHQLSRDAAQENQRSTALRSKSEAGLCKSLFSVFIEGSFLCQPSFHRLSRNAEVTRKCCAYDEENHKRSKNTYRYNVAEE